MNKLNPYSNNQISVLNPLSVVKDVLKQLKTVSIMYGYKMPEEITIGEKNKEPIATNLAEFVVNNFGSLEIREIEKAFTMASTGKLNVNIDSYGKILIIPILSKVLQAYRAKRNIKRSQQPKETILSQQEKNRLNCNAVLSWLSELETIENLTVQHYNVVDNFIHKFGDDLKKRVYLEELEKENFSIEHKKNDVRLGLLKLSDMPSSGKGSAIINSKIRLVTEFLKLKEIKIDYTTIETKIKEHYKI